MMKVEINQHSFGRLFEFPLQKESNWTTRTFISTVWSKIWSPWLSYRNWQKCGLVMSKLWLSKFFWKKTSLKAKSKWQRNCCKTAHSYAVWTKPKWVERMVLSAWCQFQSRARYVPLFPRGLPNKRIGQAANEPAVALWTSITDSSVTPLKLECSYQRSRYLLWHPWCDIWATEAAFTVALEANGY